MKYLLHFVLIFLFPAVSFSQAAKFQMLDAKDPLIGEWEWVKNDTNGIAAPLPDQDWQCFKFAAGTTQSMAALSYDEDKGYGCPTYFIAFSDGKNITGTVTNTCTPDDKGKKFSFGYSYDATQDQLIIIVRGERFLYKRKTQ